MAKEQWRTVPSEPHFEASDLGRIRSVDYELTYVSYGKHNTRFHRGRLLKPAIQSTGYLDVTVDSARYINGKRVPRRRSVASMVLEAFVGPRPSEKHQTRHLDDNRKNNQLKNLAWGFAADNSQDRVRNGNAYKPKGELHHNAKLTDDQVRQIRKVYKRYGTAHIVLAKKFGITGRTARAIGRRERWPHI